MNAGENTLRLPDGYTIEPIETREHSGEETILMLKRADGSVVAAFEFSALGPGPKRIWEIAWDDFESVSAGSADSQGGHG
jgi:hypothetical protein